MTTAARTARPVRLLGAVVFGSGLAGLGYELIWTRIFATVLGHETAAVLGVLAALFGGLALGGFVLDGPLRRSTAPWRAYALIEATIAAWACVTAWLAPECGRLVARLIGPEAGPAVLWSVAFLLPGCALLPATVAMGGTLIVLERLAGAVTSRARVVAGVYAANTFGAVAGVAVSMLLLIPNLGLGGALLALAAVNLGCGAVAWAMARPCPAIVLRRGGPSGLAPVLFVTGLLGIGFEVLVVRLASQVLQDTVFTFAGLLAVYLLGTALGGAAYQLAVRRRPADERTLPLLLAASAAAGLAVCASLAALPSAPGGVAGELLVATWLFLVPAGLMGAVFSHLAQAVRDRRGSLGRAAALNALGAAAAPAAAALLLVPALGASKSLVLVSAAYVLLIPPAGLRRLWPLAAGVAAVAAWLLLRPPPVLTRLPPGGRVVAAVEGAKARASVVEDAQHRRYLEVDNRFRMGGTSSRRSDWRQAQLPLLLHPQPRRALFLGVGTGATLEGAAALPAIEATGVELLPEVVALLPWFGPRPALRVVTADARRFLVQDGPGYDVIVADLFHPALDGSGALYTAEHFAAARDRLSPGGLFCQWLPLHQLDLPSLRIILRTFLHVFPDGAAWLAHLSTQTPLLALVGGPGHAPLDLSRLSARLDDAVSRQTGLQQPIDLLGLYVGAGATLAGFAGDGPLNTDDRPVVTFAALGNVAALGAPPAERLLALLRATTPDAASLLGAAGFDPARRARLDAYWRARLRFLEAGSRVAPGAGGAALAAATQAELLAVLRLSPDFDPAYRPLLGMAESLLRDDPAMGRRLLAAIEAAAPGRPDARRMLDASRP